MELLDQPTTGPGPIIYADSIPGRWVARLAAGEPLGDYTATDIAAAPIPHQWFAGTKNGLLASWPTRHHAEDHRRAYGVVVGQVMPTVIGPEHVGQRLVLLVDEAGVPLPGGRGPL